MNINAHFPSDVFILIVSSFHEKVLQSLLGHDSDHHLSSEHWSVQRIRHLYRVMRGPS